MSLTMFDVGNTSPCMCGGGGCGGAGNPTLVGTINGCGSQPAQGITVTAHDSTSGGTVLGSATTNSLGYFSITGLSGEVIGNNIVVVASDASGRLASATVATLTYTTGTPSANQWSCGKTTTLSTLTLSASTGYYCTGTAKCAYPWEHILYITDSYLGVNGTLTYQATGTLFGSGWISGPIGCTRSTSGGCSAAAMTVQYQWNQGLHVLWYQNSVGPPYINLGPFPGTSEACFITGVNVIGSETFVEASGWDAGGGLSPWCFNPTTFVVAE